jgi:hypothetical protein
MKDEETLKKLSLVLFYTDTPSGRMYFLSSYHHITNTKRHEGRKAPKKVLSPTKLDLTIKMCICMTPGVQQELHLWTRSCIKYTDLSPSEFPTVPPYLVPGPGIIFKFLGRWRPDVS